MKLIFWSALVVILYVYIGYPLLVYILSVFYKKPLQGKYVYPVLSVLISAYNEEENIAAKIKSLLELDYPRERREILIGSDGSTDKTDEIVRGYEKDGIMLLRQAKRQGKPATLNVLAKQAKGEILVLTDARQRLDVNSLKELVKHFSDPKVGSVSAELHFEGENTQSTSGVGLYWEYEKFIRKSESKIGSMLGATGALYAVRAGLFPQMPRDLILDDVYIPMHIVLRGFRAIFDKKAKVYDRYSKSAKDEFSRKARTLAGNFQLFFYARWLFNPFKSYVAWQFVSHKFLRLVVPYLLVTLFVSAYNLRQDNFYAAFLLPQFLFYILAFFGMIYKGKVRIFDVPYMFCLMNAAAVVGLARFLTNSQDVLWKK